MYNGTRDGHSARSGRAMPILGRRGLTVSAISGVDMALWDLLGRSFDAPVLDLWGGARHDRLPAYASGGWADATAIGEQLGGYVGAGFSGRQDASRGDGRRRRDERRPRACRP